MRIHRRDLLRSGALRGAATLPSGSAQADFQPYFELGEATIAQLQEGMKSGRWTALSLAAKYLEAIEEIDRRGPAVGSVIEINPDAHDIARTLDYERNDKGPRGPLHGVPIPETAPPGTSPAMPPQTIRSAWIPTA
jgi:amidase